MDKVHEAMEAAAQAAAVEKAAHNHNAIWSYDRVVGEALAPFLPGTAAECREFLVKVQEAARHADKDKPWRGDWTGYTIVANSLSSKIAWLTPGWAQVRQYLT